MKNLRYEIYQTMHGFKALKRDYIPRGKSKFYYLDPRYEEDDERSQINVSDENIPNPRMGAILAEDIKENPHNYYIWRTCNDDKVRDKHAEREGKIFNWHIPPEGTRIKTTLKCCFYRKWRCFLNKFMKRQQINEFRKRVTEAQLMIANEAQQEFTKQEASGQGL